MTTRDAIKTRYDHDAELWIAEWLCDKCDCYEIRRSSAISQQRAYDQARQMVQRHRDACTPAGKPKRRKPVGLTRSVYTLPLAPRPGESERSVQSPPEPAPEQHKTRCEPPTAPDPHTHQTGPAADCDAHPDPPTQPDRIITLVVELDGGRPREYRLAAGVTTVGSADDVDIHLDDPTVAPLHAELVRRRNHVYILDLGTTNTTHVNGRPITRRALANRDAISFGATHGRITGLPTPTSTTPLYRRAPKLTDREKDIVAALCAPAHSPEAFTTPATAQEIADSLVITEAAVKQHLMRLYHKFGINPTKGNVTRRTALANKLIATGIYQPD